MLRWIHDLQYPILSPIFTMSFDAMFVLRYELVVTRIDASPNVKT